MPDLPNQETLLFSLCKKHDRPNIYLELCRHLNSHCEDTVSYSVRIVENAPKILESTNSGGGDIPLRDALKMVIESLYGERAAAYGTYVSLDYQYTAYEAIKTEMENALPFGEWSSYQQYLESPHWKTLRSEAIERAGGTCQLCNSDRQPLHVHHRTYERIGCEDPGDLIVLCAEHHKQFHGKDGSK